MPIRPENRARYPANWKTEVVPRIRARSGNRCECTGQCGQDHGLTPESAGVRCPRWNHMPIDDIGGPKIVLTVMHLNHQPEDCRDENLLHACQGCHNRYDAPVRRAGIKERARKLRAGGDLFDGKADDAVRDVPGRPVGQAPDGASGQPLQAGVRHLDRESMGGAGRSDTGASG